MRDLMYDYRRLRELAPERVASWVLKEFPAGISARWCLALSDNALTDHFPGNGTSADDLREQLDLAVALIRLAESGNVAEAFICRHYAACARKAIEDGIRQVPTEITPDAVVRRVLGLFKLSPAEAVRIAAADRARLTEVMRATPSGEDISLPRDEGYGQVLQIFSLLSDISWFEGKLSDAGLRGGLRDWLEVRNHLSSGPEVARLSAARMQARTHADQSGGD